MNIFQLIITQPLANGLIIFYNLLGQNMGLAIIVFSFALRLVLSPLTRSYTESMKKMKDIAPAVEKLKSKYGDDKQGFVKAQTELYRQKGVNPVGGGCVLYIFQIVILIAFFRLFLDIFDSADIVASFNNLLYEPLKLMGDSTINTKFLYLDVAKPDLINITGIPYGLPGPTIILAALAQGISAKMMSPYVKSQALEAKKTPQKSDDFASMMQSSAIYTFPLLTIVAGIRFPAGLALYWLSFSIYQLIQSYRSTGWGGLTPWLNRLGLLKSDD
jgi:YidC/Oxa1 family membrane protein insertase